MDRRGFIKNGCKACLSLGVVFWGGASFLESCASVGAMALVKTKQHAGKIILPISQFEVQKTKLVRVDNYAYDIAVRELGKGNYIALLMKCTHAGQALTKTGDGFYCTLHGSRFSPEGIVESGPAPRSLAHLPLVVNKDQLIITLIDASKI